MPKHLHVRVPEDPAQESKVRKLAGSRRAPAGWILRAQIVSLSWQGLRTARIAEELGCHPKTVRKRLHRFNAEGIDGLGDRPGVGRKPRITEEERSKIIALVAKTRRANCSPAPTACFGPKMRARRPTGRWTL